MKNNLARHTHTCLEENYERREHVWLVGNSQQGHKGNLRLKAVLVPPLRIISGQCPMI